MVYVGPTGLAFLQIQPILASRVVMHQQSSGYLGSDLLGQLLRRYSAWGYLKSQGTRFLGQDDTQNFLLLPISSGSRTPYRVAHQ